MNTNKKSILIVIVFLFFAAGNVFLCVKYFSVQKELAKTSIELAGQKSIKNTNEKVLDFAKLFVEKILQAETEVDFETRLKLENSVRDLEDEEILSQWNNFINAQTEEEAQKEVKNLLELLVDKIRV